jgi:aspartyl protease family protein
VLWLTLLAGIGIAIWLLDDLFPGRLDTGTDRADLVRLVGGLLLVSAGVLAARRGSLGETVRNLAAWGAVVVVLAIGFAYRDELGGVALRLRAELIPGYPVESAPGELRLAAGVGGHFEVVGRVNGATVRFLIDTGASDIVLSPADARRAGIDPAALSYTRRYQTANGVGRGAPVTLGALAIGPAELRDVAASVNEADMSSSLLGMAFLRNLASIEIQSREMILRWR